MRVFAATACGSNESSEAPEAPEESNESTAEVSDVLQVAGHTFSAESLTEGGNALEVLDVDKLIFADDGTCVHQYFTCDDVSNEIKGTYTQTDETVNITWSITDEWTQDETWTVSDEKLTFDGEVQSYDEDGNEVMVNAVMIYTLSE